MPTVSGSGEEVESQDEVKVFKYEGDEEESEKRSSENLTEDKSSLITETEEVRRLTLVNLRRQRRASAVWRRPGEPPSVVLLLFCV